MDKEQGNKLIAEFMGYNEEEGKWTPYDSQWNLLMLVIEKIGKMKDGWGFFIADDESEIFFTEDGNAKSSCHSLGTPIENTWQATIQFIQWYNNQTPKP